MEIADRSIISKKERKGKKINLGEVKNMNTIFNECVGFDEMKSNDTDGNQ